MRSVFRFFVPLLCAVPTLPAEEGIVFHQSYRGGHRYHQTVSTEQVMNVDLGTQKMDQRMTMKLGIGAVAEDLPRDAGQRVTIVYDQAAMTQTSNGQTFSYDSKASDVANAGPLAALSAVVGREFNVTFNPEGEVKEVENFEATMEKLNAGNPSSAKMYAQLFNKDTVKQMMQQSALRSPGGKPVKPGETWPLSHDLVMPGVGKLIVRGDYTFKQMVEREGRKLAQVDAKADIQVEVGNEGGDKTASLITQMKMKIEQGTMEGTLFYDPAIRFTRDAQLKQVIVFTAEVPDGTRRTLRLPMQQTIQTTLDQFEAIKEVTEDK